MNLGSIGELLIKSFTRYFIPGLVFYIITIFLPLHYLLDSALKPINLTSADIVITMSIMLGYLLDGLGAYAWHPRRKEYKAEKIYLSTELRNLKEIISSQNPNNDPDLYNAKLWYHKKEIYERIFSERAEWVAILNSAFSFLISSFILGLGFVFQLLIIPKRLNYIALLLAIGFFVLSHLLAQKGIQRMKAHDEKLIESIRQLNQEKLL
ncbi:hypothetical protein [Crocosphaera sp. Alani8]|uniref:hypothetical protein n=1 Tax=Crocosphaera sp. Alani8 TaxID=3038952 RepID=UPI00313CC755